VIEALDGIRVAAVCDTNTGGLESAREELSADTAWADYDRMLEGAGLDAVLVATPMQHHAAMSIAALDLGLHVLCEVPAAVSVEECRSLAAAAERSAAVYMMAENYLYSPENRMVTALARAGLFGTLYYGEGEYLHELKELGERTPWRRKWQTGVRGVTYPTHSLGPILQWFGADRVARVACEGSGARHVDPRGAPYHDDSAVMLCKMVSEGLVKIRVDMISDRPHAMACYQLQGTDGAYESGRGGPGERPKVWLRMLDEAPLWRDLDDAYRRVRGLVPALAALEPVPEGAGHRGGDYFVLRAFLAAVRGDAANPVDVHRALDMTLPGLVSQQSILERGRWLGVPESRGWKEGLRRAQLTMIWPEDREPPDLILPADYVLRPLDSAERQDYVELMHAAGFPDWPMERFAWVDQAALPDGHFVVVHRPSGRIVATALAAHRPSPVHPAGGELGWVATHPEHRGRGLACAACAAALRRLRGAGYGRIYLLTDDFRLDAIRLYLRLGFRPLPYEEGMDERWEAVHRALEASEAR
jgi:predicted dehydrogenase/RimJ/RimL family protein N-acetyltransferase